MSEGKSSDTLVSAGALEPGAAERRISELTLELQASRAELRLAVEQLQTANAALQASNTELNARNQELQDLLTGSDSALLLLDADLNVRQFTQPIAWVFALQDDDIGRPIADIRHRLLFTELMSVLATVSGGVVRFTRDVRDNQGNHYILRISPTQGETLHNRCIVLSLVDINERVQTEKVLRESEERFRMMVNSLPGFAIHLLDPKGYVMSWNDAAQQTTGFKRSEVLGRKFDLFFQADVREAGLPTKLLETALVTGRSEDTGWRVHGNGSLYWSTSVICPLRGESDEVLGFVRIAQDKSNQRERELRLHKFSQAIEQSHQQIIICDPKGRIEYVNPSYSHLTGLDAEAVIGADLSERYPGELSNESHEQLRVALESASYWQGETRLVVKDGGTRVFRAMLSPLRDKYDELSGFLFRTEDVTEHIRLAEAEKAHALQLEQRVADRTVELERARQHAEHLAKTKSDFLANMSHEIRTPMNAVLGMAQVLGKMPLPAESAELAKKIQASGELLLGVLNDILDFSKIEAGKIDIEHAPFYLGDVLDNLATIMATAAAGKGLELSIAPPPSQACFLLGDALRLGQVLINLTSNAIKFTLAGSVQVRIAEIQSTAQTVSLHFSVTDTGIGIDDSAKARLFAPFIQADASTTRRYGGSGLGLVISRRLVEMMGGQLELDSAPGKGSCFSFTLTLTKQASAHDRLKDLLDLNILAADDNDIALDGLGATLRSIGWTPEMFDNGQALLQRVMADPALQSPRTVLLVDWLMPDLDGLALVQALHEQLPEPQRPIALLVTAHGATQFQEQLQQGLIDGLIAKPVGPSLLYDAILNARNRHLGIRPSPIQPAGDQRLAGIRLLIVDDSEINLEVAEHLFGMEGAQLVKAANGKAALDWLAAHSGEVDMVLMDVHMPVMDGLEATRHIRQLPVGGQLPILALTAGALKDQQEAVFAAGMNGFIPKPFVLDKAIAQILDHRNPATSPAESLDPPPIQAAASVQTDLINSTYGEALFRNRDLYSRYLRQFVNSHRELADTLNGPALDPDQLQAIAHKLRGSAGNLGLDRVSATATRLETRLLQGLTHADDQQQLRVALLQTFQAIGDYLAAGDTPETQDAGDAGRERPAWQPARIAYLLGRILDGLRAFNPEPAETALSELQPLLAADQLTDIREAVIAFDFEGAEIALRRLANQLNIPLEP